MMKGLPFHSNNNFLNNKDETKKRKEKKKKGKREKKENRHFLTNVQHTLMYCAVCVLPTAQPIQDAMIEPQRYYDRTPKTPRRHGGNVSVEKGPIRR
jgi:hypothetical protein